MFLPMRQKSGKEIQSYKVVTYTNSSSVTIAANSSSVITLSTSDTDLTNYSCIGVLSCNTAGGSSTCTSFKAFFIDASAGSTISVAVANPTSSSLTISANKVTVDVRVMKFG